MSTPFPWPLGSGGKAHEVGAWFNNTHEIRGTVTVEGEPASQVVLLIEKATLRVVSTTVSDGEGKYSFRFLDPSRGHRLVLALYTGGATGQQYNAVVADQIEPVPPEE